MNPSILYPKLRDQPWYCAPYPTKKESRGQAVLCHCRLHQMIEESPVKTKAALTPMAFKKWTYSIEGHSLFAVVGVGTCSYCRAVHWSCDNLFNLIKMVEHQEREEMSP